MGWDIWNLRSDNNDEFKAIDTANIVKELKEIKSKGLKISLSEHKKKVELEQKLSDIQSKCTHYWKTILLFNKHSRFCQWCDKEDFSYVHKD